MDDVIVSQLQLLSFAWHACANMYSDIDYHACLWFCTQRFNKLKNSQENDVLCLFLADDLVKYFVSSSNKTRNSAIADKPRDALVQYAVMWLTPNTPIPHVLPFRFRSQYFKRREHKYGYPKS